MADYNITLADGTTIITVPEGAPLTAYTIPLVGQNTTTYGDDVAQAFLHLLENFASATDPANNSALAGSVPNTVLPGQLWYDSGNGILNVNTSASATTSPTWSPIASTAQGATTDSTLRWDGTNWVEASRVRSSAAGVFSIWESGGSPVDNVSFTHDGTNFVISTTGTADIQLAETGTRVRLPSTTDASLISTNHPFQIGGDGTANLRLDANEIMAVNNGGISTLYLQNQGGDVVMGNGGGSGNSIYLRARGSAGTSTPASTLGQVWVNSGDGELYFTYDDGTDHQVSNVSAGGTVGGTGSANRIAYWTGASTLSSSSNLTYDGTNFIFRSANFGDFFINRSNATGGAAIAYQNDDGVKGYAGFNDLEQFEVYNTGATSSGFNVSGTGVVTANGLTLGDSDNITLGSGSDVLIDFDGTDMVVNAAGATNIAIDGADMRFREGHNLIFEKNSGASERITFKSLVETTSGDHIVWRDNADNLEAQIFFYAGLMDIQANTVWLDSPINKGRITVDTESRLYSGATGTASLAITTQSRQAGNDNTTAATIVNTAGSSYDIGYNITPTQGLAPSGTYSLTKQDASKYFSKDGILASSTVEVINNADIPVGFTIVVANDGTTVGNITILQGSLTSLQWLDGSGAPPTGTRTLAIGGVCTVRKATENPGGTDRWVIWGTGLS